MSRKAIVWTIVLVLGAVVVAYFGVPMFLKSRNSKTTKSAFDIRTHSAAADSLKARAKHKADEVAIDSVSTEIPWVEGLYGPQSLILLERRMRRYSELSQPDSTNDKLRIKRQRKAGLDLAAALVTLYDRPWVERSGVCQGLDTEDGVAIMDMVKAVLEAVKAEPEDIPLSPSLTYEDLRRKLSKDLHDGVAAIRETTPASIAYDDEDSEDSTPDTRYNDILTVVRRGVQHYGFTLDEIGLNASERELYAATEPAKPARRHRR